MACQQWRDSRVPLVTVPLEQCPHCLQRLPDYPESQPLDCLMQEHKDWVKPEIQLHLLTHPLITSPRPSLSLA